jgi:23S rRNA (adenine2503-C2)-methyltransferase
MIEVMGMSARSITVSTVGMVPGIRRLAEEPWPVNLAISLHAADEPDPA